MAEGSKAKPKFKVGQVVKLKEFQFAKIRKVLPHQSPPQKPTAPHCYLLEGLNSAFTEAEMRALTEKEKGNG